MTDLAQIVGINKQAISQFENHKNSPEPMTLRRIADALRFPYSFFVETDPVSTVGNTYFRALYSSKKKDLAAQQVKAKYLAKIHSVLSSKVKFKPLNLPDFAVDKAITIEEVAIQTRQHWDLGDAPIPNMVALLERNGIIVGEFATDSREIDAFYQYYEEQEHPAYCVVLGTDKRSFYRRQFNCAHELGHILLHERYSDLNEIDREEFRAREDEANAFAAAFLLPAKAFGNDVAVYPNRLGHYIELKKKWNVSIMAMIMRAYSLGYLSVNQYSYLMRQMSTRGYRQTEPLDDNMEYKHPYALKQSIDLLLTKGNMSGEDIMSLFATYKFSVSANVIEELLNLEAGTLSQSQKVESKIIEFPSMQN
ncbi:MAG: ImmA/IrrE family metallo-endopeptidase [Lachnospiraceae bacterium]|nr:ImmA/IrrE family metallo-endopeptidase [Lachnospiraceae bacterium]